MEGSDRKTENQYLIGFLFLFWYNKKKKFYIMNNTLDKTLIRSQLDLEIEAIYQNLDIMFSMFKEKTWSDSFSKNNIEKMLKTGFIKKEIFEHNKFGMENIAIHMIRELYVQHYGFVAINENFVNDLSSVIENERVLEVGAGTGFLAKNLQDKGINLIAVDNAISDMEKYENTYGFRKTFTNIIETDAIIYLKENFNNFDTILMVWPPMGESLSSEILKEMKSGQKLIYIGEGIGGCTGNETFFKLLNKQYIKNQELSKIANQNYLRFPMIKDHVSIYEKN